MTRFVISPIIGINLFSLSCFLEVSLMAAICTTEKIISRAKLVILARVTRGNDKAAIAITSTAIVVATVGV